MPHPMIETVSAHAQMFVKLRRELQQSCERNLIDFRASDLVAGRLEQWGYRVDREVGGGGVVAQLRRGTGARRLGLCADLGNPALQDAAGQFGHTAMLLAAAHYLARQGDFSGTLNLLFQDVGQAEGGAHRMVAGGLFERYPCDALFAMRSVPGQPQGRLLLRDGPAMASCDKVTITLHAGTAYGAADPVVAGAAIVMGLQGITARGTDPLQQATVQVQAFAAGTDPHLQEQVATLRIEVRSFDARVRADLQRRITALAELQALSYGVQATVDYRCQAPVLVNSAPETDFARQVATELLGPGLVQLQSPAFAGDEDFAFLLQQVPGSYLQIGNGEDAEQGFDERNLPVGAGYWAMLAQCYLH